MRKKLLALALVFALVFALCACGGEAPETQTTPEPTAAPTAEPTVEPTEEPKPAATFDGTVYEDDEARIEIIGYEILEVGSEYNKYGDVPLICFKFNVTNLSDWDVSASGKWIDTFRVYQDNDPNFLNELNVGSQENSAYHDTAFASIKKGGTVESVMTYELDDMETPITLVASYRWEEIGSKDFDIAQQPEEEETSEESNLGKCTPETLEAAAQFIQVTWKKNLPNVTYTIKEDQNLIVMLIENDGFDAKIRESKKAGTKPSNWSDTVSALNAMTENAISLAQFFCGDDVHVGAILVSDVDHNTAFLSSVDGRTVDDYFA